MRGRWLWWLPATAGLLVFALADWGTERAGMNAPVHDWVIRLRGRLTPHPDLVLLTQDRGTYERLGPSGGDEDAHLRLLETLYRAGARAVLYASPPFDDMREAGVLAEWSAEHPELMLLFAARVSIDPFADPAIAVTQELEPELRERFQAGVAYLHPDEDGTVRRVALELQQKDRTLPGFAGAAAECLGAPPLDPATRASGSFRPAFVGPARSYPSFSLWRVVEGDVPLELLKGKICLVGRTDSSRVALYPTPTSETPLFTTPMEVQANALDALLSERYYREIPPAWYWGGAAAVTILLTWIMLALRPLQSLAITACYLALLVFGAAEAARHGPWELPLLPLAALGAAACVGSLGMQLVSIQDDLLDLLTGTHRTSWLFKESGDTSGAAPERALELANLVLRAQGVSVAFRAPKGGGFTVAASSGWGPDAECFAAGQTIQVPAQARVAVLEGAKLRPGLLGPCWVARLNAEGPAEGWLVARLGETRQAAQAEPLLISLAEVMSRSLSPAREGAAAGWWDRLWELPLLRVLSSSQVARVVGRLTAVDRRNRAERDVLTRMLDDLEVGLILCDGTGRVRLANRFYQEVAQAAGVPWAGANGFELLERLTQKDAAALLPPLAGAFQRDVPATFPVKLEAGIRHSFLLTLTPLRTQHAAGAPSEHTPPAWPDHFLLVLADVTALQQLDAMKTELLQAISYKARNHLAVLIGYSDLIQESPELATELSADLKAEAVQLTEIFDSFQTAADFSLDHRERKQKVPINMTRMAKDVIQNLAELARSMQVELKQETEQLVNLVLADEQGLRTALISILYTCLSSSRPGATVTLRVSELEEALLITIQGEGCILSPRMIQRLLVRPESEEEEEEAATGEPSEVPQLIEREGLKWLRKARTLIEENEGRILVSELSGMGAEFRVSLPKIA
ncbi:MAG: CHASE2 domain-containing protein [Planctomycetes bacterium]|nr:CHASE2 domain-containing protein [Planctomycetota bacterium]